jgi:hypothetical protein
MMYIIGIFKEMPKWSAEIWAVADISALRRSLIVA